MDWGIAYEIIRVSFRSNFFIDMYAGVGTPTVWPVTNVKLIDLLTASRKNESIKAENRVLPLCLFVLSLICIGISAVLFNKNGILPSRENMSFQIAGAALVVGTFLLFNSLSTVFIQVVRAGKGFYLKGLNTFLVRQIGSKIRTNYLVVTIVCGLLTITICAVSIGASTALAMNELSKAATPYDLNVLSNVSTDGDSNISEYLAFKKQGFELNIARTLKEAEELWTDGKYDLLVLDVSLPDGSGFEFCKRVRLTSKVPIIFLTASDEETSIIMGLDIGGDDYITKPFKLGVLVSRINALLRRANSFQAADTELQSNGIKVLLLQGQVFKNGELLDLTAAEYKLLCLFMRNPNMVLTKGQILDKLWDCDGNYIDSSTLTVYMRRLRMKIEDNPSEPQMLLTVRGMGYKWNIIG